MTTGLVMTPWSPSPLRYMSQVMFVIECVPPSVYTTVSHRSCALMCLCRCAFVENTRASDHSLNNVHCHRLHFLRELDREVQERHCQPIMRHSQLFAHVDSSTVFSSFSCISGWVPRTHVLCGIARSRIIILQHIPTPQGDDTTVLNAKIIMEAVMRPVSSDVLTTQLRRALQTSAEMLDTKHMVHCRDWDALLDTLRQCVPHRKKRKVRDSTES